MRSIVSDSSASPQGVACKCSLTKLEHRWSAFGNQVTVWLSPCLRFRVLLILLTPSPRPKVTDCK